VRYDIDTVEDIIDAAVHNMILTFELGKPKKIPTL
jgi:hypothetical protein